MWTLWPQWLFYTKKLTADKHVHPDPGNFKAYHALDM